MPYELKAECPCCGCAADDLHSIDRLFGFRTVEPGSRTIPQSYCRICRASRCTPGDPRHDH